MSNLASIFDDLTVIDSEVQDLITKVVEHIRYEEWNGREQAESRRQAVVATASSLSRRLALTPDPTDPPYDDMLNAFEMSIYAEGMSRSKTTDRTRELRAELNRRLALIPSAMPVADGERDHLARVLYEQMVPGYSWDKVGPAEHREFWRTKADAVMAFGYRRLALARTAAPKVMTIDQFLEEHQANEHDWCLEEWLRLSDITPVTIAATAVFSTPYEKVDDEKESK